MTNEHNSLSKIISSLLRSFAVGSFLGMSIGYPIIGTIAAPIGIFFALFMAAPLLPVVFGICVYMDRKGYIDRKMFQLIGTVLGASWGGFLDFLSNSEYNWFPFHFVFVTALVGFFSGWLYWRRMYSEQKGFKFF